MHAWLKSLVPAVDFGWNRTRAGCGLRTCHNKLLVRSVPQSRAGIHVGTEWYCSADCFAAAMQAPLTALIRSRLAEMPRNPRLSVGLALLSKGVLTEDQLREAAARSQWRGQDLEATLLQLGFATEKQLAGARSAQWGYPVLTQEGPGPTVRAELPLAFLRAFEAVPVHYAPAAKRLVLGFVRRVEPSVLQAIEQITGCRVESCFVTPAEFEERVERCFAAEGYEEALLDQAATPAHMARSLGGFAVETSARQVAYVACKSWIWVRLEGKRKIVDVLFALRTAAAKRPEPFVQPEGIGALG
ncbi:MAG: hypothetical protein WBD46_17545 [Acidobacteriaceae bacterium]